MIFKSKIFSGSSNVELSKEISKYLRVSLSKVSIKRFKDGELDIEILENVRGADIFIIQSVCTPSSAETLMELLVLTDAIRRSSPNSITAIVPYLGYARQDRRSRLTRVPITSKLVANMIANAGVDKFLTIDLHSDQTQGFFDIPVDNIYASFILNEHIKNRKLDNLVIVSPDVGGVMRARASAKKLGDADLAIINKRRPEPNKVGIMDLIGDVKNRNCCLIDDIVDTAGTICQAANLLKEQGAISVFAYATHPVLSDNAIENIENSELDELIVTNTIPLSKQAKKSSKIKQVSIGKMLADIIIKLNNQESITSMFK